MPQQINNLELELKRHRLNLEFIRMIDLDSQSNSQDNKDQRTMEAQPERLNVSQSNGVATILYPDNSSPQESHLGKLTYATTKVHSPLSVDTKHHLDLEDTEHPDLKIGLQKNGKK